MNKRTWTMKEIVEDFNNHQNWKLHSSDVFIPIKDLKDYKQKLDDEIEHITDRVICIPNYSENETHVQYAYRYTSLIKEVLRKRMGLNLASNERI